MSDSPEAASPGVEEFAAQLFAQLFADLDGILFAEAAPADDAAALLRRAAESGAARGALWILLAQAARSAYRALATDAADDFAAAHDNDETAAINALVVHLLPRAQSQLPALRAHAERLGRYTAVAEAAREPLHQVLARAIVRLYQGLADDDEALGGRGLLELRSMSVYLDAAARVLDAQPLASAPVPVLRPDRFHDHFLRFGEIARQPARAGERVVAALSREGRISAVATREEHPLETAERELRTQLGDDGLQNHTLARIKALLAFIERLRRNSADDALCGQPLSDATAHTSLVIAAATAPLAFGGEFALTAMAQLTAFNLRLLRPVNPRVRRAH